MKRLLLAVLASAALACAKSAEENAPPKETTGPAALDPRASKPMLEKARKAAAEAEARNAEAAAALQGGE